MKYTSDYPERFASVNEARAWIEGFTAYYNHEHRHSGIGYHTPASVHYGTAGTVREQRQATLDQAYRTHPERFARRPAAPPLPVKAAINDPAKRTEPSTH
jgi:putative transposase